MAGESSRREELGAFSEPAPGAFDRDEDVRNDAQREDCPPRDGERLHTEGDPRTGVDRHGRAFPEPLHSLRVKSRPRDRGLPQ